MNRLAHNTNVKALSLLMACWLVLCATSFCVGAGPIRVGSGPMDGPKPVWWQAPRPVLETWPGYNLYWNDPTLGWTENCQTWAPQNMGCTPVWYSTAEVMALIRAPDVKLPFATLGPSGPWVLSTSTFDDEMEAGTRVVLGRSLGDWYRVEASWFGSYDWSDSAAVRNVDANAQGGVGNLYSPFGNFGDPVGLLGLDFNDFASIRFSSTLNNGELNLKRRVLMRPGVFETSFLFGARYMRINDSFGYLTEATMVGVGQTSNAVNVAAKNELFGGQVGMTSQFLLFPRSWIDFDIRGGILQNQASQATVYRRTLGVAPTDVFRTWAQRDRTSFVGELSLQFNMHFSPSMTAFAGYRALWVTGVALGVENFNDNMTTLQLGPGALDHTGDVVYHGPSIGLVFAR